jgi:hypothetical protein
MVRWSFLTSNLVTDYQYEPGRNLAGIPLGRASMVPELPGTRGAFFDRRWCNARCFLPRVD